MIRNWQSIGILGLFLVGLWGCSQGGGAVSSEKSRQLEGRLAKLEAELKSTAASRDALKQRLAAIEEQVQAAEARAKANADENANLTAKIAEDTREKANLTAKIAEQEKELNGRLVEKDAAVAQYDDLVKKLEGVLGQAKINQTKRNGNSVPATVTSFPK
jgi:chromosome segregation ATPase